MIFEWDERKRVKNMAKHGIDFVDAVGVFDDRHGFTFRSTISNSEERFLTIGTLGPRCIVVVFVHRGDAIRIISARRAREKERRVYEAKL